MNFFKPVVSTSLLFATLLTGNAIVANKTLANPSPSPQTNNCYTTGYGISAANYPSVYNKYASQGYRATWLDGYYDKNGNTFYNFIASKCLDTSKWASQYGLTGAQYDKSYKDYKNKGYRVYQVDSYLSKGEIRYAVVYVKDSNKDWKTYYYQSLDKFQEYYKKHTQEGYHLYDLSIVEYKGKLYFTTAYKKGGNSKWEYKYNLTPSDYKKVYDQYRKNGWHLYYLDAYIKGGKVYFSAIWNSEKYKNEYAPYNLKGSEYQNKFNQYAGNGYKPFLVTGYYKDYKETTPYYAAGFVK